MTYLTDEETQKFTKIISKYPQLSKVLRLLPRKRNFFQNYPNEDEFTIFGIALSNQQHWSNFLSELDFHIRNCDLYSESKIRSKIFDNPFNFLSEIEISRWFDYNKIKVEIDPQIYNDKNLDLKIELDSEIYIEITTLKKTDLDRQAFKKPISSPITAEIEKRVINKIEKHNMLEALKKGFNKPIVILFNGIYRGIDNINVQSTIRHLNENNKEEFSCISAIILRDIRKNLFLFENKNSQNHLTEKDLFILAKMGVQKIIPFSE